jgi:hypothetical protein
LGLSRLLKAGDVLDKGLIVDVQEGSVVGFDFAFGDGD